MCSAVLKPSVLVDDSDWSRSQFWQNDVTIGEVSIKLRPTRHKLRLKPPNIAVTDDKFWHRSIY